MFAHMGLHTCFVIHRNTALNDSQLRSQIAGVKIFNPLHQVHDLGDPHTFIITFVTGDCSVDSLKCLKPDYP